MDHDTLMALTGLGPFVEGRDDMSKQEISNLGRLVLLRKFGGVWADATLFCRQPLDVWLPDRMDSGFFAFRNPSRDRLMSNWFIAAEKGNFIIDRLHRDLAALWRDNRFTGMHSRVGNASRLVLKPILNRNPRSTRLWLTFLPRRVLKIHPYAVFHYIFNTLVLTDSEAGRVWDATPRYHARSAHALFGLASAPGGAETAIGLIDRASSPVYKLSWKKDLSTAYWRTVLAHLRRTLEPTWNRSIDEPGAGRPE